MGKRWTKEDDETLKKIMLESLNMEECYKKAVKILNRTRNACYYRVSKFKKEGFICTTASKRIKIKSILKEEIRKSPGNLKKAFIETGKKVGLSPRTLTWQYYSVKNSPLYKKNIGTCFILVGTDGEKVLKNTKNTRRTTDERIADLEEEIKRLKDEQKRAGRIKSEQH